jgi:hypothetical protein
LWIVFGDRCRQTLPIALMVGCCPSPTRASAAVKT